VVVDAGVELARPRSHDVLRVCEAERDEQQTGLIDVTVVGVDDRDRRLGCREGLAEPVGGQGSAGPAAEDHNPGGHTRPIYGSGNRRRQGRKTIAGERLARCGSSGAARAG
jgi:hypothetical protein